MTTIVEMRERTRTLVERAEDACLNLEVGLTTDLNFWHYIDQHRSSDPHLRNGVPPQEGFDVHPDDEILPGDWLVAPPDYYWEYTISDDAVQCCEAATIILQSDPSGQSFRSICQSLIANRSENWRPLGWIATIPDFDMPWHLRLGLIRDEMEYHLNTHWDHIPEMLAHWIVCEVSGLPRQLTLLESMF